MEQNVKQLMEKWSPVLDAEGAPSITDAHRRQVTAVLLENTQRDLDSTRQMLMENQPVSGLGGYANDGSGIAKYDPVLINLVRRAAPQMIAYDLCGVQPLTQPTGLIFALRSRYTNQAGAEALFNEADSDFSGTGTHAGTTPATLNDPTPGTYTKGVGIDTGVAETLGGTGPDFGEMSFTIERIAVEAKTRALKASYSVEMAQDLKALHGISADDELGNILSTEILAETNREVLRTMYIAARKGAEDTTTPGVFDLDVDSNGRWLAERHKGLVYQIEREANRIAQTTRRGKGNFIVCTSDVASALAMVGKLDYSQVSGGLNVDESSATFAGVFNGRYKVYVDPFSGTAGGAGQFFMVGYKGSSAWDAGMYYCPYIPLQLVRTIDPNTFTPRMAYRMRYGIVQNPFHSLNAGTNDYYRRVAVANLI
ncbi:major capsid protein [Synechococcus phage BUCT-ZZ01]|nr:major capsid protein [Synechococcus phage BUCT-ZZ01]